MINHDYILKIDFVSRFFFYSYTSQYTGSEVEWEIGQAKIDGQTSNYFVNLSGQNPTRAKNRKNCQHEWFFKSTKKIR